MAQITVKTAPGKDAGSVELDDAVFGVQPNVPLMHQVVTAQLAAPPGRHAEHEDPQPRCAAAARSRSSRRAPATPARARSAPRTTAVAASPSAPSRASTTRRPRRR